MTAGITLAILLVAVAVAALGILAWTRRREGGERDRSDAPLRLGAHVLVAVGRPRSSVGLTRLAAALTPPEEGRITVLNVQPPEADATTREGAQAMLGLAEVAAREAAPEIASAVRVDASAADGILHTSVQAAASLIVIGWPSQGGQEGRLGPLVDRVVSDAPCPLLIARLDADRWSRVVLHATPSAAAGSAAGGDPDSAASLRLAVEALCRIAHAHDVPAATSAPIDPGGRRGTPVDIPVVEVPDAAGPLGVAGELTVVAVAPTASAVAEAVRRARPMGDLVLALSHGIEVHRKRALLPSAQELLDGTEGPRAALPADRKRSI